MYQTLNIIIKPTQKELIQYFHDNCCLAKNLYNTTLFRCRQILSANNKDISSLTSNEISVLDEFELMLNKSNSKKLFVPNYYKFDRVYRDTNNLDYLSNLPQQSSQQTVKEVLQCIKSYFSSIRKYNKHPEKFSGKPKLPKYLKSEQHGYKCTNQDCVIKTNKNGQVYLKLPKTKLTIKLKDAPFGKLKEVVIKPFFDTYKVSIIMEVPNNAGFSLDKNRILGIDLGVNNFATTNNNCGLTPFIINGRKLKSYNQWYNKELAALKSYVMKNDSKKYTSKRINKLNKDRYNHTEDFYNKAVSYILHYCVKNNIGLIVIGKNDGWKQNINLGHENNQIFCNIAHAHFIKKLQLASVKYGIEVVDTEESYTSKSNLLNMDILPTIGDDVNLVVFTGKRIKRGLYQTNNNILINADVNGAGNIIRKYVANAFKNIIDMSYMHKTIEMVNVI